MAGGKIFKQAALPKMKICRPKASTRYCAGFIMNVGCLGIIITIALLWGGGQALYTALKNSKPLEIDVETYIKTRPDAEWVTLTNGSMNRIESVSSVSKLGKTVTEVFTPLRPVGQADTEPVHILISSKDSASKDLVKAMSDAGSDPAAISRFLKTHGASLETQKPVSGLVKFGIDADSRTRDKLNAVKDLKLSPGFVIIADGEKPSLVLGLVMTGLGLIVGFFVLRRLAGGSGSSTSSPPPLPGQPPKL